MKAHVKIFVLPLFIAFSLVFCSSKAFSQHRHRYSKPKPHKVSYKNHKHSYSHKHYYHKSPRYGTSVVRVHHNAVVVKHGRYSYHYHNGTFYRHTKGKYIVTRPCIGLKIGVLPVGFRTIVVRSVPYYYHAGVFYKNCCHNQYEVIAPPVGAVVEYLPEGTKTVFIDNREYYAYGDIYYKPIVIDGYLMYEVVG